MHNPLKAIVRYATLTLAALFSIANQSPAQPPAPTKPAILLGAAWYPEQWPESRWATDLDLMQAAHLHVVRVGEFAWSTMEPSEGHFDFAWLDRAIAAAAARNIVVVLGTPTAAPPAWLTSKYPGTLRVDEDGRRAEHGNRQQFSSTSPQYRHFAKRIAEEMATRYGHNPNVIGWQIDNELAAPSFDDTAKAAFHAWLKTRYGTIAELNRRWTTAYWSQTYDTFDQIPVRSRGENPALLLDWKRFVTDTWVSYIANQTSAIRAHADARQWITTNTMHFNSGFDHYIVHKDLDIAAWDDYMETGHLKPERNGLLHDLVRGYKLKNFWLMETQPGFVNWAAVNRTLDRGVVREMAWQAIAHGADAILYWQWRSALNGQEEYHGTLVGADGTPQPIYSEIKQLGEELEHIGSALAGTTIHSKVALLNSYDSRWAIDFQRHNANFDYAQLMTDWYAAIQPLATSADVISPDAPLDQYSIVFAPALNVLPSATAAHLRDYVEHGGTLILGPRSGMKDIDNALQIERQPGPLVDLLGGRVEQFYAVDQAVPITGDAGTGNATIWAETLSTSSPDTTTLLRYGKSNGWLDNQPAVITRSVGQGRITYIGAWLDQPLTATLFKNFLAQAKVPPPFIATPEAVELAERSGPSGSYFFLLNHSDTQQQITLPSSMLDILRDQSITTVTLPPRGVSLLKETAGK
jgi:beta-galactosidase